MWTVKSEGMWSPLRRENREGGLYIASMIVCRFPQWLPHWTSVPHWSALVTTIIWWCVLFQEWWIVDSWVFGATIRDYLSLLATICIHWTVIIKCYKKKIIPPFTHLSVCHPSISKSTFRHPGCWGDQTRPQAFQLLFSWNDISYRKNVCSLRDFSFCWETNVFFSHNIWKRDCLCTVPQKETSRSLSSG